MKDYGRKPYITTDYTKMMRRTTQQAVRESANYKQSEMDKPYITEDYSEMEQLFPIWWPGDDIWDFPWMDIGGINVEEYGHTGHQLKPKGGVTPTPLSRCNCKDLALFYTTLTMGVDQDQALAVSGLNASLCHASDITWELSGGGSLSNHTGFHTIYHSPSSNPNCTNNATITARCASGGQAYTASVTIAINQYSTFSRAYSRCHNCSPFDAYYCYQYYTCWDEAWGVISCFCGDEMPDGAIGGNVGNCVSFGWPCADCIWDNRGPEEKAAGCCPHGVL